MSARTPWRSLRIGGWIAVVLLLVAIPAWAQQRFPPPEFESGYRMPETTAPAVRAAVMDYLDIALLLGALGLASYLSLVKRSRPWLAGLSLFSVLYFGFFRGGCVCVIGSIQNVALAFFQPSYVLPVTVGVFFVAPIVVALFFGRAFCAGVCPHGALQDLVLVRPVKVPAWLEQGLSILPYCYLGAGVLFAATGSAFIICRADPFIPLFRLTGSTFMVLLGVGFVVLAMFVGRPYCRFMCPYGAILKLAGLVSKWFVRVTPSHCSKCRICEEVCPYGAIRYPEPAPPPEQVVADRRRLLRLAILLPVLVGAGVALGATLAVPLARLDANVALAERFAAGETPVPAGGAPTPDRLALTRAELNAREVVAAAVETRRQYRLGGWLFGGWIGLVAGVKLLGVSRSVPRVEYEPDRGACLSCGRCFKYCPHDRVRKAVLNAGGKPAPISPGAIPPLPKLR